MPKLTTLSRCSNINIYGNLWLIDGHEIGLSIKYYNLLKLRDEGISYSWKFMAHWWTFMTKNRQTMPYAPAQPRKGLFMEIQKIKIYGNLWLIDGHFLIKTSRSEVKVNFHFSHLIGFLTKIRITCAEFDNNICPQKVY